ncbi:MAG: aspartyl-phosphate phosphatase Spo0E family protein [Clostridia bacterium]|nr:aspartyl-phosphate phosphatase Spo0E family protein [Clostridia bacterium]
MLNDEICKLREKLNESIIQGQDYTITYKLSVELDELIAKYYRKNIISNKRNTKNELVNK